MASTAAVTEERTVSIGTILGRAFGVMGDNPVTIFGVAFLLSALPQLAFTYVVEMMPSDPSAIGRSLAISIGSFVVFLALGTLVQGALVRAAVAFSRGERASIGECLAVGLSMVVPLTAVSLLAALGMGMGFLALVVPGVILMVMWSVVAPVLVNEKTGVFEAFSRSRFLTKGARWKVSGLLLILVIILSLISLVFGVLMVTIGANQISATGQLSLPFSVLSAAINTFTTALWSTAQASLYISLRNWKEGPQADRLADVFA